MSCPPRPIFLTRVSRIRHAIARAYLGLAWIVVASGVVFSVMFTLGYFIAY